VVVQLDLDVLVLKPLDALFDWMLADPEGLPSEHDTGDVPIMWPELEKPRQINAFFTRDCKWWFTFGMAQGHPGAISVACVVSILTVAFVAL
jgi:hypothetical protein